MIPITSKLKELPECRCDGQRRREGHYVISLERRARANVGFLERLYGTKTTKAFALGPVQEGWVHVVKLLHAISSSTIARLRILMCQGDAVIARPTKGE